MLQPLSTGRRRRRSCERALADRGARPRRARRRRPTTAALTALAVYANGDARVALNLLEQAVAPLLAPAPTARAGSTRRRSPDSIERRALLYDKGGEEHYNIISALHKSIRNSDADAGIYWLARMLEAGEDPLYVARRLVRFASEDIGNADPRALEVALAAKDAVHFLGMPEAQHRAGAGRHYLAAAPKSNAVYVAYGRAARDATQRRRLAGAAAPPQRADRLMKDARLRRGLPVRARRGRGRRRDVVPAGAPRGTPVLRADGSRRRGADQRGAGARQARKLAPGGRRAYAI